MAESINLPHIALANFDFVLAESERDTMQLISTLCFHILN